MLWLFRIGSGHQNPELGVLCARVPDLLPIDDPFVAVKYGARCEASKVRTGTRLGEQPATDIGACSLYTSDAAGEAV